MVVLAQRVGGSGHAGQHLHGDFIDGHIPNSWEGHQLKQATLNLVLQVGVFFSTPKDGRATKQYEASNGETYYLQAIRLSVFDPETQKASDWVPGLIHRNRPHPPEFDNVIEIIAPDLGRLLRSGKKEWFKLDGPFESMQIQKADPQGPKVTANRARLR